MKNIPVPLVAIGGIKENNLEEVLKAGAKTAALVTEITGAPDIRKKVESLVRLFEQYKIL